MTDVAVLRNQPSLFGEVSSAATVWRTFDAVDEATLAWLRDTRAAATARLFEQVDNGQPMVIDVEVSLFEVHSEHKEGATPHFKGGVGLHPMFAFCVIHPGCRWPAGCERVGPVRTTATIISTSLTTRSLTACHLAAGESCRRRPGAGGPPVAGPCGHDRLLPQCHR